MTLGRVDFKLLTLNLRPLGLWLIERQDNAKVRAWRVGRLQTDGSAVRFNDALGDRQSQPCAAQFAVTDERLEETLANLDRDARAIVGHINMRLPIQFYRPERNPAAVRHRLDGIGE